MQSLIPGNQLIGGLGGGNQASTAGVLFGFTASVTDPG
jgi:hypothetical protein